MFGRKEIRDTFAAQESISLNIIADNRGIGLNEKALSILLLTRIWLTDSNQEGLPWLSLRLFS